MKQSTSSRRQPLVIMITTAGTVRESVFDSLYQIACDIADGKMKEPTFLPILYELDAREEWTDPTKMAESEPGPRDDQAIQDPCPIRRAGQGEPGRSPRRPV